MYKCKILRTPSIASQKYSSPILTTIAITKYGLNILRKTLCLMVLKSYWINGISVEGQIYIILWKKGLQSQSLFF